MFSNEKDVVTLNGFPFKKRVLLADVNIPYKFSLDRSKNQLFFCINGDEFSDQSFQSVILDLGSGATAIIPSIRNGFATAVDNVTGNVYLGGNDGIYKYNYHTKDIEKPAVIRGVDVFDMFFKNDLYYVDTTNLDLHVYRNNKRVIVESLKEYGIHHFAIDKDDNIIFVNPTGLFVLPRGVESPLRLGDNIDNIRCITTDKNELPYLIAKDGIYSIDVKNKQALKISTLDNGYSLAFDNDNHIIYSEERLVAKLEPQKINLHWKK